MNDLVFAGNKALYLVLMMSAWPIIVATVIGLLVGLFQTVTQLQEQTLPFASSCWASACACSCCPAGTARPCSPSAAK
ncbi:type III secretion system protein SpaQ [Chromobacterium violaceum]|uniref:Type III secretion system protein SpaQ n=1 Tax=Chromobacterium violaceum TaxID=536 RepID=A0A3S4IH18_CHRVL|nr:type III secretion system protein SpaQ [Chromobacterium violaceum]